MSRPVPLSFQYFFCFPWSTFTQKYWYRI